MKWMPWWAASFRTAFCSVPDSSPQSAPCRSATTRYIAHSTRLRQSQLLPLLANHGLPRKLDAVAFHGQHLHHHLVALAQLAEHHPDTRVSWLVRRHDTRSAFGGGDNDQLEQRGALGSRAKHDTSMDCAG